MASATVTLGIAGALGIPESRCSQLQLRSAAAGGNSRVYVFTVNERTLVAKQYFRGPSDARDRLQAEWAFLEYAVGAGIDCVPKPVARNSEYSIGIYEYIAGRHLATQDVSRARVQEAAAFFLSLNDAAHRPAAALLAPASEACFTILEHIAIVDSRVARLSGIRGSSDEDLAASTFVKSLQARWLEVREHILRTTRAAGRDPAEEVEERCVSPSDFGFHNALLRETGSLCFLDFEYAGWDDPAKLVADFFSHPGVPVPREHFEGFAKTVLSFSRHSAALEARTRLLELLFRIKWCCIVMNEFVPEAAERRRFAMPDADATARKRRQLYKARSLLGSL